MSENINVIVTQRAFLFVFVLDIIIMEVMIDNLFAEELTLILRLYITRLEKTLKRVIVSLRITYC